jgi:regulator of cell morphogenesis and NO signaling
MSTTATQVSPQTTVGQLVVERPARARAFERLGIDYCCGGKKPLADACAEKGLDLAAVLAELDREAIAADPADAERNWGTASMTDLADHIERTHHAFLKAELPRLEPIAHKVAIRHGPTHPELAELYDVFMAFKQELETHMMKEERILFPLCRQLDSAADGPAPSFHCGSVANPISVMIHEHDDAGRALQRMRELTNDFTAPPDACNTFRAYLDSLHQIEQDMHQHVHKENNILFPKAVRTEVLLKRAGW